MECKKRDKKIEDEAKLRKKLQFDLYVGDDTGLLKKVKMLYNYQTEVYGHLKGSTTKDGEEEQADDESVKKQKLTDEGEIAEIKEKVRQEAAFD
mgnify:CR=1 FL=1|jgi:hypothetical protein